jgi:prepilin-type N-terminal cleavage/methylation domain-containing protein
MNNEQKHSGFSLTEVLIAVGILAVGMTFIAGVFPAGIYLTTIATERTVAAVAADEAFAKIRIYNVNLASTQWPSAPTIHCVDFNEVSPVVIDPCEFEYPSTNTAAEKQYFWSALCRRVGSDPNRLVQVTVFVSRKVSPNLKYYRPDPTGSGEVDWITGPDITDRPVPVKVVVDSVPGPGHENELSIRVSNEITFINDGYTIVDDATGRIYRVLERYKSPDDDTILLDRNWDDSPPGGPPQDVWVVPSPVGGGRYPCIAVYQKVIRF